MSNNHPSRNWRARMLGRMEAYMSQLIFKYTEDQKSLIRMGFSAGFNSGRNSMRRDKAK